MGTAEPSHELQERQRFSEQQPQYQPGQQQTIPTEPEPAHSNHAHDENRIDAVPEQHPPPYEPAKSAHGAHLAAGAAPAGQATVTPLNQLGANPQWIDCPFCHKRTQTTVRREGGSMQIVVGAVLCVFCICLTCLPCLLHWFEDTEYHCSECKNRVAMRRNDGPVEVFGPPQMVYSQYGNQAPMNNSQQPPPQAALAPQGQPPQPAYQHPPFQSQQQQQQQQQQQPPAPEIQMQPMHTQTEHPAAVKS